MDRNKNYYDILREICSLESEISDMEELQKRSKGSKAIRDYIAFLEGYIEQIRKKVN